MGAPTEASLASRHLPGFTRAIPASAVAAKQTLFKGGHLQGIAGKHHISHPQIGAHHLAEALDMGTR